MIEDPGRDFGEKVGFILFGKFGTEAFGLGK